ncbi:DUF2079 domain-containing protein [Thermococcus sp. LS1]|nr:DUF2079 domain-containing protein [Thermococcus sp. LS1]
MVIKTGTKKSLFYVHLAVFGYITFFSVYSILRHYVYLTSGYDLGIFIQSLWTTAHNQGLLFNTGEWQDLGVYSHFGTHNQPILLLLVPLYKLFPYAETLLIIQTSALGLAAYPLFKFAYLVTNDEKKATFVALLYLMNPAVHGINRFDFHPVSLAVPFIFLTAYYLEKHKYFRALLSALVILTVKEDAGLALISLGLVYIFGDCTVRDLLNIRNWTKILKTKKMSTVLISIGILWILISMFVVVPMFNPMGYPYFSDNKLGEVYYSHININGKLVLGYILVILMSLGFLPLLKPRLFLATLPLWLENILSSNDYQVMIGYQYPYMLIPLLFILIVYGLKDLEAITIKVAYRDFTNTYSVTLKKILVIPFLTMLLFSPAFHVVDTDYVSGYRISQLLYMWRVGNSYFGVIDEIVEYLQQSQCPISTHNELFPHLANRLDTYYIVTPFNSTYIDNKTIILIESTRPSYTKDITYLKKSEYDNLIIVNASKIILECYSMYPYPSEAGRECIHEKLREKITECERRSEDG